MLFSNFISITNGIVIDVDEVIILQTFETGENEFILVITINITGGVARNNEIPDLAWQRIGAGDFKLGYTMIHCVINSGSVISNIKVRGYIDIEFWNDKLRFGGRGGSDSRINGRDFGVIRISGSDIGHNRSED